MKKKTLSNKTVFLAVRVSPAVKEKMNKLSELTQYTMSDIVENWILSTKVDPITKEFITYVSSSGPVMDENK